MASRTGWRLYPRSVKVYSTLGGHFRVDGSGQQAAVLHLPELSGQDLLAHAVDGAFQLAEALRTGEQIPQDQHLPFVADERQRGLYRTGGQGLFYHVAPSVQMIFCVHCSPPEAVPSRQLPTGAYTTILCVLPRSAPLCYDECVEGRTSRAANHLEVLYHEQAQFYNNQTQSG